ncbi:hypothetical protein [Paraburkholderia unamae]|uniref:Uncharacterized protein n=1 Tax=Paraburkholderia unamae TaxID=219649 RepID=A0ACC6RHT8_9BURK
MDMKVKATSLNEKAMLVKLTTRRVALSRRDSEAELVVQDMLNDGALCVNRKLFRDKANPVNRAMSAVSEIYTYHKANTMPWQDAGPRIIANSMYFEYCSEMKTRIAHVEALLRKVAENWDLHVQADINFRNRCSKDKTRATVDDYPRADEFLAGTKLDLVFTPLPDANHFLFDLADDDRVAFDHAMEEVAKGVRRDVVLRMLEPLSHLVSKLSLTVGAEGSIFRDSAIENVIEGCELARKLNIDDDPEIAKLTKELGEVIAKVNNAKDAMRSDDTARAEAKRKLAELQSRLAPYMGSA